MSDGSASGRSAGFTRDLSATLPDAELSALLERKGNLTLRDATIVEALFVLREQWNVDMVIADDVEGQVNATFRGASLREILDSLLLSRGYGYQIVGRSIVILPLQQLGSLKPLFNTDIIRLKHADPDELIDVVDLLLSRQGKALPLDSSQSIMILDYPDRMRMIRARIEELDLAAGETAARNERPTVPDQVDAFATGVPTDGTVELDVRVFRPQFVKVQTLLPAIESLISRNGRVAVLENEDQVIVAEQSAVLDVIEEAVAALDQPRPQVRIWAMIYDCSLDDVERLGVNWRSAGFGNGRRMDGSARNQLLLSTITAAAPAVGVPNGALSLMSLGTNVDISAVINALQQSNDSRLLADPNVVVTNHEPAKISIVTEVPYQQLTQGANGSQIGTTAFREAGVSLEVTPHIARDGTISMIVNPQFSVLTGFTENDEQPIINRREAKTTVRVMNGETFVLGGLRQRTRIHNRSGIPFLKDVRYVGRLFRYRQDSIRESELLVFITPEIVSAVSDPRPRELAADVYSREELDRNRRAPDIGWSQINWDDRSFGGPWRSSAVRIDPAPRSDFGFTTPDGDAHGAVGDGSGPEFTEPAQTFLPPASGRSPYESETPPATGAPAGVPAGQRPMSQQLQGSIRTMDQGTLPPAPAGRPAVNRGRGAGTPPAGTPGLNLDNLLQLLPMSGGQRARPGSAAGAAPAGSTPTTVEPSRIELLKFQSVARPYPDRILEEPVWADEPAPSRD